LILLGLKKLISISLLSVGKVSQEFVLHGEQEYLTRLRSFARLEFLTLNNAKLENGEQRVEEEGKRILEQLARLKSGNSITIGLDESGKQLSSTGLAKWLEVKMTRGTSKYIFIIGGASGLSEQVKSQTDLLLSLSPMTFPRQLCRLILVEQIYRAASIIQNTPYHKE
jgi:23S rRNA (pseudouridine1915-N3)-methyltransferase